MHAYRPFWVLENKVHKYTRIHLSECRPHCNNGQGPRPGHTGCWHGFASYQDALAWARSIGWPVFNCRRCAPEAGGAI